MVLREENLNLNPAAFKKNKLDYYRTFWRGSMILGRYLGSESGHQSSSHNCASFAH